MAGYTINAILIFVAFFLLTRFECCKNNRGSLDRGRTPTQKQKTSHIPQYEIDSIASCLLPVMRRFFESEEGKREFEEWRAAKSVHEGLKPEKKSG